WQCRLGTLRIDEDVRLVGPFVDGGTTDLHEPDGLGLRHPLRRRRLFNSGWPIVMLIEPPGLQVLVAEDPRFALPVRYRCATLARPIGGAGVVPVVALAACDIRLQVAEVVGGRYAADSVCMIVAVPPVAQRPVEIDADRIDGRRGPQR